MKNFGVDASFKQSLGMVVEKSKPKTVACMRLAAPRPVIACNLFQKATEKLLTTKNF